MHNRSADPQRSEISKKQSPDPRSCKPITKRGAPGLDSETGEPLPLNATALYQACRRTRWLCIKHAAERAGFVSGMPPNALALCQACRRTRWLCIKHAAERDGFVSGMPPNALALYQGASSLAPKAPQKIWGFSPCGKLSIWPPPLNLTALKGHDFSRAEKTTKNAWALAPARPFLRDVKFLRGLSRPAVAGVSRPPHPQTHHQKGCPRSRF
jgi:hypothetical protein